MCCREAVETDIHALVESADVRHIWQMAEINISAMLRTISSWHDLCGQIRAQQGTIARSMEEICMMLWSI